MSRSFSFPLIGFFALAWSFAQGSSSQDATELRIGYQKGKRVAFNKGSDVHWLVVAALRGVGLSYTDIQPVYLTPADARAAFQRGAVDAWAIWDPFFVAAQQQLGARVLTDAAGIVQHYQYFLSTRNFAEHHRDALDAVMDEAGKEGQRVRQDYGAPR